MRIAAPLPRLLLAVSLSLAGCSSTIEPGDVEAAYVLRTVQGEPLPAVALMQEAGTITVITDTLWLFAGGVGEERILQRISEANGEQPEQYRDQRYAFTWRLEGRRVEIDYPCADNALCVPPPHIIAELVGDDLEVEYFLNWRVPQRFERIR